MRPRVRLQPVYLDSARKMDSAESGDPPRQHPVHGSWVVLTHLSVWMEGPPPPAPGRQRPWWRVGDHQEPGRAACNKLDTSFHSLPPL